ncbi:MAG: TonB-dependent receptor, partial [Bdellovibrionales bacterium]|nr:TonB-dependent receptor [Bdellovibrionales bacterium]
GAGAKDEVPRVVRLTFFTAATWQCLVGLSYVLLPAVLFAPFASDGVTVTATRSPWPSKMSAVSQTTLEELDSGIPWNAAPGTSMSRSGGAGQLESLSLRGAPTEHTLVLWDGVRWNDPLHPTRGADLSLASGWLTRSVEVARGPHSVVHGSDGMGGVVQLLPWEPKGRRGAEVQQGFGSFSTTETRARIGAATERGSWQWAGSFTKSRGISAADAAEGNTERDGHYRLQNMARAKHRVGSRHQVRASGLFTLAKTDTDSHGGGGGDRDGTHSRSELGAMLAGWETRMSDRLRSEVLLSELRHLRTDNTAGDTRFRSRTRQGSALLHGSFPGGVATLGADFLEEAGLARARTLGGFLQVNWARDRWFASLGARRDRHDRFGPVTTLRAAPGFWILQDQVRAKASAGTSFKAPSLYQLSYGDLRPERAQAWDAGLEWSGGEARVEMAVFENRFRELIEYDLATSRYRNTGAARTWGVEAGARVPGGERLTVDAAYTWLRSRKYADGTELLRRPRHQAVLGAELEADRATWLRLQLQWKGRRWDTHPLLSTRQRMPAWLTAGLQARWAFLPEWTLYADLENLFDRSYQDVSGYGTVGRSGMMRLSRAL